MSLAAVSLLYRDPISTLIEATITSNTAASQLEIGNKVTKPLIRRAKKKVDVTKGGIPIVTPG